MSALAEALSIARRASSLEDLAALVRCLERLGLVERGALEGASMWAVRRMADGAWLSGGVASEVPRLYRRKRDAVVRARIADAQAGARWFEVVELSLSIKEG